MKWQILHGDVRRVCKTFPENHFDAVLSDPPYGLSFMGRRWDYSVPSAIVWHEVERVMKPGAHAMIFGGPRTFHRLVTACEDGGLIPRDLLMWLQGQGFPKSHDVSKAIDDRLGHVRKKIGTKRGTHSANGSGLGGTAVGVCQEVVDVDVTAPASDLAKRWHGQGTALKPSFEPILLACKYHEGTIAENAMQWGVGGLAIDACRIDQEDRFNPNASANGMWSSLDQGESGRPAVGRWPANVILSHADACELVGHRKSKDKAIETRSTGEVISQNRAMGGPNYGPAVVGSKSRPDEEVWKCAEGCPVKMIDVQSGNRPGMAGGGKHSNGYLGGMFGGVDSERTARGDSGGASRFFYTAKADRYQRESGLQDRKRVAKGVGALRDSGRSGRETGNTHTTVKPIDLIRYLATLILPPKRDTPRRILVPFSGVSSEMIGCLQAGWDEVVGIEREAEYIEIAKDRIMKGGVLSGLMDRKMRHIRRERE